MVRYVVTVKLGVETGVEGFVKTVGITIRDTVTGKTAGGAYSGPEDLVKSILEDLNLIQNIELSMNNLFTNSP